MNNKIADVIYFNGYIYTADSHDSVVDAIALKEGYILATGTSDELHQYVGPETESIDLEGKMMMPVYCWRPPLPLQNSRKESPPFPLLHFPCKSEPSLR